MNLIELSQELLKAVKAGQESSSLVVQLKNTSLERLLIDLESDDQKKTFWINLYNAFTIILLKPEPSVITNMMKRKVFFNQKQIIVAGIPFSLNDIEHHLLRKSRVWWSKGYLKKPIVNELEKQLRVKRLDPRIHFALNCGGASCPPIRYYEEAKINEQLDIATQAFLHSEVYTNKGLNTIKVSRLFNWYIGDFGGKKGIISFLKRYNMVSKQENPQIIYADYSWEPSR